MLSMPAGTRVYLAIGVTDMRKSINGLSILVADFLDLDPLSGSLFAFCNRKQDMMKVLWWDRNGFCLWHKRLEKDRFLWPESPDEVLGLTTRELTWLMDGLSVHQDQAHGRLEYSTMI